MVASAERPIRMAVVHDRSSAGFYVAMISAELSQEEVDAALRQLGVEAEAVLELGGWKTATCGVAVARVPFPDKQNQFGCIWNG
jgi:hypothetical protein